MSRSDVTRDRDADGDALLEVRDLRTVFRTGKETIHAVDGVSFDIRAGETVGLVGESGSGKSVTARSILGLVDSPGAIEEGSIRFDGTDLVERGWEDARGDIAIVFQDPLNSINPVYTVGNQIREALRIHRDLTGAAARSRAIELLESVGIPDAARRVDEYPHQFSGGMQQRAMIAIALACDPDLLVCDEPTTALDVTIQAQILDLLDDLQRREDLAILFITHDMGVIEETADRVNVIYAGNVVERASTDALFADPQHPYTRALLESVPGRSSAAATLPTIDGEVPTPTEQATNCRFAPRCPAAGEVCSNAVPEHVARADGDGSVACFVHDLTEPSVTDVASVTDAKEGGDAKAGADATATAVTDAAAATDASDGATGPRSPEPDRSESFVEIDGLRKYYGDDGVLDRDPPVRAVDGVSFEIRRGEILGLVGESGCGKTTLGRTLAGLETATGGSVIANGRDVTELSGGGLREWQREVGVVFQDPEESLNDRMTVGQIVKEPLEAHDWGTPSEREDRVFELLDRVGLLEEHFYRYPHQFSGGQRQRVGIARALALSPEFLVLDEPVSALDVSVQARIINLLREIQETLDITMLFIAHDLSVVRHITDRVAVMYLGNLLEIGPTEAVFDAPANPYTLSLLSAIPGSTTPKPESLDRVTLRGSPPNPRYPPSGCPFSTRCPVNIRAAETADLSAEAWEAIEAFRAVLRERSRTQFSLARTVRRRLGIGGDDTIRTLATDLFGDIDLPDDVAATVDAAVERGASSPGAAADLLAEEFGSVCEDGEVDAHAVDGADHRSRCLRHEDEHADPSTELRRR
ncbi:ABC transporter ATP-binding protein [Halorubrum sp. BOL3-1]|uniref:ABC transporter ATP-binding protein n=1 Tax=Halorubrum sp. BOL3-1 TaxID=2497325 RepID=UPI0010050250|nr:ABC transporter ATP-binding protein [Halorubrum sp. BOL3-1]QAU13024.1 ABC transporter ATP-binding protein [Halorubrum sp. BOL3-1]